MGQQPQNNDHNLIADRFRWSNVQLTQRPQMSTYIDLYGSSDLIISNDSTASNDQIDFSEPTERLPVHKDRLRSVKNSA